MRNAEIAALPAATGWLGNAAPLDVLAGVAASVMLVIAVAQWIASYTTDRVALRLFALRYALAALGWTFAHPRALGGADEVPIVAVLVAVGLTALTASALEVYLGRMTRRRALVIVGVAAATAAGLWLLLGALPGEPRPVYVALALGMLYCAVAARRAAATERNVGHGVIAGAFLSYPIVVFAALLLGQATPPVELAYLVALPLVIVGIAVLVASLIRFSRRLEVELSKRQEAEAAVRELNASLEQRVAGRTAELRMIVDGLAAFTRNVSHDLRGPLSGVAGVVRLAGEALEAGDTTRAGRLLGPIADQADRLVELVHDLSTLARLEDAHCDRRRQPLRPLVDQALAQLALSPETAELIAAVPVDVDELPPASVDAGLMRQIFVNLIGNALRFAHHGSTTPRVRVGAVDLGSKPSYFVADNGPGFPPEQAQRLFEPFARLHGAGLSRNGVGLSIVRRIVEVHGGRVWAESRAGGGATFRFELGSG